ncbi:HD domain-containing protein [Phenylobacterium sp.]|uniref:HD domain-containing protein n=1 Tax=Phenylobacterium sp. TaxID=1871053 RepID=UPI00122A851F|nr:HD domain-containing protein [Phenylobacterium sp.]THD59153.1 MAG: HD domain-containing protein [Phenylobacterium sp.]
MVRLASLEDVERLYAAHGGLTYGEGVTQMEHAAQCAALAQAEGAPASLVAAALLHDVGHLLTANEHAADAGLDERHEITGAQALKGLFGEAVRTPIALHVAAKRYLCFAEPGYFEALSPASVKSLALQGGPFDAGQAAAFERRPYWREAAALRRWDDLGKREDISGGTVADYESLLRGLLE